MEILHKSGKEFDLRLNLQEITNPDQITIGMFKSGEITSLTAPVTPSTTSVGVQTQSVDSGTIELYDGTDTLLGSGNASSSSWVSIDVGGTDVESVRLFSDTGVSGETISVNTATDGTGTTETADVINTLTESSTFSSIVTEPDDSPRATVTISNGTFSFDGDNGVLTFPSTAEIDVSGATRDVDHAFALVNYDASDQLYFTTTISNDGTVYDLSQADNFVVGDPSYTLI